MLKYLVKFLVSNSGNLISINKLYNDIKSLGLSFAKNTLYDYISYLEDAYIIFSVKFFTKNIREQQRNPSKFFILDNGIRNLLTINIDKGKLSESIIYLYLRRKTEKIYYYHTDQEVDFLIDNNFEINLINVCYDISELDTRKREINSLLKAMGNLKLKVGYLITNDEESEIKEKNKIIKIIPAWKWLLNY